MSIRKALLVGINEYPGAPLRGCVNDVVQIKDLLTSYYGFAEPDMRILLDDDAGSAGIIAGIEWLSEGGDDADAVRVFHFSGHGTYVADNNGDEPDGSDECLVPYDYNSLGMITDDTLKTYYDRFPESGNLTLIMDCCHSGSAQRGLEDVFFRFMPVSLEEQRKIDAAAAQFVDEQRDFIVGELAGMRNENPSDDELFQRVTDLMSRFEKKRFGDIRLREANVLLAGCRSDQQAADAFIGGAYNGAFSFYLAEAIRQSNGQITYADLAGQVMDSLDASHFTQIPQLEYRGDTNMRPIFQPFL